MKPTGPTDRHNGIGITGNSNEIPTEETTNSLRHKRRSNRSRSSTASETVQGDGDIAYIGPLRYGSDWHRQLTALAQITPYKSPADLLQLGEGMAPTVILLVERHRDVWSSDEIAALRCRFPLTPALRYQGLWAESPRRAEVGYDSFSWHQQADLFACLQQLLQGLPHGASPYSDIASADMALDQSHDAMRVVAGVTMLFHSIDVEYTRACSDLISRYGGRIITDPTRAHVRIDDLGTIHRHHLNESGDQLPPFPCTHPRGFALIDFPTPSDRTTAIAAGYRGILPKPFRVSQLAAALQAIGTGHSVNA